MKTASLLCLGLTNSPRVKFDLTNDWIDLELAQRGFFFPGPQLTGLEEQLELLDFPAPQLGGVGRAEGVAGDF